MVTKCYAYTNNFNQTDWMYVSFVTYWYFVINTLFRKQIPTPNNMGSLHEVMEQRTGYSLLGSVQFTSRKKLIRSKVHILHLVSNVGEFLLDYASLFDRKCRKFVSMRYICEGIITYHLQHIVMTFPAVPLSAMVGE